MYKINEISLIITTLLVFLILLICSSISNVKDSESKIVINEKFYSCITYESSKKIDENHNMAIENARNNKSTDKEWKLEIESINLKANISEGTDKDTLNKYIGHFENTKKDNGNIIFTLNKNVNVDLIPNIDDYNFVDYYIYTIITTLILLYFLCLPYYKALRKDLRFYIQNKKFIKLKDNQK